LTNFVSDSAAEATVPRAVALRPALAVLFAALVLTFSRAAFAHAVGLSRGTYLVDASGVRVTLTFARTDAIALVPSLDANHDGVLTEAKLDAARRDLERGILGGVVVDSDGAPCVPSLDGISLTEEDGLEVHGIYACTPGGGEVHVALRFLERVGEGHRHVVHAVGASVVDEVGSRGHAEFAVRVGEGGEARDDVRWPELLRMGVEHILAGYDHLVFLFGLVLVGGRLRAIVAVITAFTVAHSITLALATLGLWAPPPGIVEPAIALSIACVGVENFFVTSADRRWRITFPFGLVHGFGFAGALRAIGLPRAAVPEALFFFNLGVEAGQLAVLALLLPLVYGLRRFAWFRGYGVKALSACVVLAGVMWFVGRVGWG